VKITGFDIACSPVIPGEAQLRPGIHFDKPPEFPLSRE
jgi:hypothetical protein